MPNSPKISPNNLYGGPLDGLDVLTPLETMAYYPGISEKRKAGMEHINRRLRYFRNQSGQRLQFDYQYDNNGGNTGKQDKIQ